MNANSRSRGRFIGRFVAEFSTQIGFRREFVTCEDALHAAVLFFARCEQGAVYVVDEKYPESEHQQEMGFAQILDVDQPGDPIYEKSQKFAVNNIVVEHEASGDFNDCQYVNYSICRPSKRVMPEMRGRVPARKL